MAAYDHMNTIYNHSRPKKPIIVQAQVGTHPIRRVELWNLPEYSGADSIHFRALADGMPWQWARVTEVRDTAAGEVYFLELR